MLRDLFFNCLCSFFLHTTTYYIYRRKRISTLCITHNINIHTNIYIYITHVYIGTYNCRRPSWFSNAQGWRRATVATIKTAGHYFANSKSNITFVFSYTYTRHVLRATYFTVVMSSRKRLLESFIFKDEIGTINCIYIIYRYMYILSVPRLSV